MRLYADQGFRRLFCYFWQCADDCLDQSDETRLLFRTGLRNRNHYLVQRLRHVCSQRPERCSAAATTAAATTATATAATATAATATTATATTHCDNQCEWLHERGCIGRRYSHGKRRQRPREYNRLGGAGCVRQLGRLRCRVGLP